MEDIYDYIVIGGGPSGLSCATMLSKINKKVLLVDSNRCLGGCHRVDRVDNLFSHHSPMVYTDSSVNFRSFLNEINYPFYENFIKYDFSLFNIANKNLFKNMGKTEWFHFSIDFIRILLQKNHLKDISIGQYMISKNFNKEVIDSVDKITRLSDGGDAMRYSANNFFQLPNQNIFYNLYQPKIANDNGLFKKWEEHLKNNNVKILLDTKLENINLDEKNVYLNEKIYRYKNIILAIPLKSIKKLLPINESFVKNKSYNEYISITFHYSDKISIEKIHGFPSGEWGVYFIIQSDYTKLNGTVISATISDVNKKSSFTGKTANETKSKKGLINECFRQLKLTFPSLKTPDFCILNKNVYRQDNEWKTSDSSFLITPSIKNEQDFLDYELYPNVYTIGTHTGKSFYKATSIETAITNSINVINILEPETKMYYTPKRGIYFSDVALFILLFLIFQFFKNF